MIKAKGTENMFSALEKQVKQFKNSVVKIGLPEKVGGTAHENSNMTVAQIGAVHEYGVPEKGIPKRSFLREPMIENRKNIQKLVQAKFNAVKDNIMTAKMALAQLGEYGEELSKNSFRDNNWEANSDITIARKGKSTPLIDQGQLRNTITYTVEKR